MYTSNLNNLILNSDSYKTSHWVQYPSGSEYLSSYIEARKGDYDVVFFGLQAFIKEYLSTPITHQDIDEAEKVIKAHGLTFNRAGCFAWWLSQCDCESLNLPESVANMHISIRQF